MLDKMPVCRIRNLLILSLITVMLLLAWSGSVSASTAVITGGVVNVRSGPGTEYTVAGNLLQETEVQILEIQGDWYKISKGSLTGWVSSSLMDLQQTEQLRVIGDPVNLRSGPGTSYDRVAQAQKGELLTCLGTSGEWYQVRNADGVNCYVAAFLVEKFNAAGTVGSSSSGSQSAETNKPATTVSAGNPVVYLNGQKLSFEVEPAIENGRTLVPLRAIFEAMGASVEWNNSTRTVTAVKGDTTVVLPIGSTQPTVNGREWPLDVPAKIYQDRTLAPLRFVGEAFGGTVAWEASTRTINITSAGTAGSGTSGSSASGEVRTVVVSESKVNLRSGPSTGYNSVDSALQGEKLAVLAEKDGWYQVSRSGTTAWVAGWVVNVAWEAEQGESFANTENTDTNTGSVKPIYIPAEKIWISSSRSDEGIKIVMESGSVIKANLQETSGQIIYEISSKTVINDDGLTESIGSGKLNLTAVNESGHTTVKITLPAGTKYLTASENGGKKEVLTIPNQIVRISREVAGSSEDNIIIYTLGACDFSSSADGDTLEVQLNSTAMGLERTEYTYSISPVLEKMTISQRDSADPITTLIIKTKGIEDYRVFQTPDDNALNISLTSGKKSQTPRSNVVVLDAGHGGKDTGAIGFGTYEKDINLAITLRVGQILESRGVNVEYTRTNDTYLTLTERAEFANNLNAALFVSIHNNSATNAEAHGTETYYYAPITDSDLFWQKAERSRLANCIQDQLVKSLGRRDRGVKQDNFTVLVKTKMPSALAEISFLSNAEENALLVSSSYQARAAQAIADGILEYLGK